VQGVKMKKGQEKDNYYHPEFKGIADAGGLALLFSH